MNILLCFNHYYFLGVFTAPQSGLYLLSVYGTSGTTTGHTGPVFIKKNEDIVYQMRITGGNSRDDDVGTDTNSCIAVAEVTPSDSVRVTGNTDDPAFIYATHGAGFVGHLIQPYCS